jgi:hypothetical protein
MTNEQRARTMEIGTVWGEQEVELFHDQHDDGALMPEWTRGTYCGDLPDGVKMDGSELAIELEDAIDNAAKTVWDKAMRMDANDSGASQW